MINDYQKSNSSTSPSSTIYNMARNRRVKTRNMIVHRESSAEAIELALQNMRDKFYHLERERDAAVNQLCVQKSNVIDGVRRDCNSIENKLNNILQTCDDAKPPTKQHSKNVNEFSENCHRINDSSYSNKRTCESLPISSEFKVKTFGFPDSIAKIRTLISILQSTQPIKNLEVQTYHVADQILTIVERYLRQAILDLRFIVGYLSIEWVQMSRTVRVIEDSTAKMFLNERIRLLKTRRVILITGVHQLETLQRKITLLRTKFDKSHRSESLSSYKENDINDRIVLELLKCLENLHNILSNI